MIIHVSVKPNSKQEYIEDMGNDKYIISVFEKAIDNKANNKVIDLVSKKFKVSWKRIKIKNPKSRNKIIEIED